jgi:broad specificity phosphatase PhoE
MKSTSLWVVGLLALLCVATTNAHSQSTDVKALAAQLKQGGYVIVFRHGATNRDQADTDPLNYDNVARQRLLSTSGKEVAVQVGAAFKTLGIPIGTIYTSKFNRAVETGKLIGGGEATTTIDITEGGLVATPIENDRRAAAMRKMAATAPAAGTNTLMVSHKPNIIDAFGKDWFDVKEGEASIFRPTADGKSTLVARVQVAEWLAAVK